jgi:dethiobiotin synthetase
VSFLRNHGVPIAGIIMNDGEWTEPPDDPSMATNAELIERYSGLKVLGRFPRLHADSKSEMWIHTVRQTIQLAPIRQALGGELK